MQSCHVLINQLQTHSFGPRPGYQPRPGWAPDPLMVGIRSPDGLVVGSCTSHPGVLGSKRTRENRAPPGVQALCTFTRGLHGFRLRKSDVRDVSGNVSGRGVPC
jgi:hypothetical protein